MSEINPKDLKPGDHIRLIRAWHNRNVGKTARVLELDDHSVTVQFDDTEAGNPSRLTTYDGSYGIEKIA